MSCQVDHGLEPIRSAITGIITFGEEWPAPPQEVRIIASKEFPPADINDVILGESLPFDISSYEYSFFLEPDTFKMVGVAWIAENTSWDLLSTCGFYFSGDNMLAPGEVVLSTDTSVIRNIHIEVDRSKARKITDTKIIGSIHFNGTWPEDCVEVRVIASTIFSLAPVELPTLLDLAFSDVIQPGIDSLNYIVKAFPARFVATGVIFLREGQTLSTDDIFYSAQVGGLNLTPFTVPEDSTIAGPDFTIQF